MTLDHLKKYLKTPEVQISFQLMFCRLLSTILISHIILFTKNMIDALTILKFSENSNESYIVKLR